MIRYAIGVGCRRGCPADAIARLVRDTWGEVVAEASGRRLLIGESPGPSPILGLFSIGRKANEPGLGLAARSLGLALHLLDDEVLAAESDRVPTPSAFVAKAIGLPSVAEAAALAGAGPAGRLLAPRRARDGATCAVAVQGEGRP